MTNVFELTTDPTIEYPQSYLTVVNGVSFLMSFRYNAIEDFLVLTIIRVLDKQVVYQGKMVSGYSISVYSPNYHYLYFGLMPITTDPENVLIYLLVPGLI